MRIPKLHLPASSLHFAGIAAAVMAWSLLALGCTRSVYVNPDEPDVLRGTGIDSQDVRTVAQEMSRSLVGARVLADAPERPVVALLPVKNETRDRIDTNLLTLQMRDLLIQHAGDRIIFVARDRLGDVYAEREAKLAGEVSGTVDRMISGADFFLTGTLKSIHTTDGRTSADYVYYSFELIDAVSTEVVWAMGYDVKKVGRRGVLYR